MKEFVVWVNIYAEQFIEFGGQGIKTEYRVCPFVFKTEEEADKQQAPGRIGKAERVVIKKEIEE